MLTDATDVQRLVEAAAAKGHGTEFVGGLLRCRCGWTTNELFLSAAAMEAAAQRHLQGALDASETNQTMFLGSCAVCGHASGPFRQETGPDGRRWVCSDVLACIDRRASIEARAGSDGD